VIFNPLRPIFQGSLFLSQFSWLSFRRSERNPHRFAVASQTDEIFAALHDLIVHGFRQNYLFKDLFENLQAVD
jgi:hypothetical protein